MEIDNEKLLARFAEFRRECGVTIKEITEDMELPPSALYNYTRTKKLKFTHQMALDEYLEERGY